MSGLTVQPSSNYFKKITLNPMIMLYPEITQKGKYCWSVLKKIGSKNKFVKILKI
jgi:hypothetical protein